MLCVYLQTLEATVFLEEEEPICVIMHFMCKRKVINFIFYDLLLILLLLILFYAIFYFY